MKVASSPPPSPQLAVQVTCSGSCINGIDGYYLASELDEYGTTVFTHDPYSTLGDTWRIINTECGWNVEVKLPDQEEWRTYATTQCSECNGSCRTLDALTTDETSVPGVSLALGEYEGGTFTPLVQPPPPPPPPQLAVQVSVSGFSLAGVDGTYLADELDDGTLYFTKNGTPNWRIMNSGNCGWTMEDDFAGYWVSRAVTYKDYYKEDCDECTGSCLTDEALTTDEVYYVDDGEPWSGVTLVRGTYDGENFVAA